MKIKCTTDGRDNIFIPEQESLIEFLKDKKMKYIHCFIWGRILIGADWKTKDVIGEIKKADAMGLVMEWNMWHQLAVIDHEGLKIFQINITLDDLEIIN